MAREAHGLTGNNNGHAERRVNGNTLDPMIYTKPCDRVPSSPLRPAT